MIFVFALLPLYCVAFLKLWGAGVALLAASASIIIIDFFLKAKKQQSLIFLLPLAVMLRCFALFSAVREKTGLFLSVLLVFACLALSAFAAYKNKCAFYSAIPTFFVISAFALYTAFTSQPQEILVFDFKNPTGTLLCAACLISSCKAVALIANAEAKEALKGLLLGIASAVTVLIFGGNNTDFGFAAVLISVVLSALEIKAFLNVILNKTDE